MKGYLLHIHQSITSIGATTKVAESMMSFKDTPKERRKRFKHLHTRESATSVHGYNESGECHSDHHEGLNRIGPDYSTHASLHRVPAQPRCVMVQINQSHAHTQPYSHTITVYFNIHVASWCRKVSDVHTPH